MEKKTAIVTGASGGIGFAIAQHFLQAGHNVVLNSSNAHNLEAAFEALGAPSHATTVVGDVADAATGKALVQAALEKFNCLDVLINNAGVFKPKPFLDVTGEELEQFLSVNLKGSYYTSQAAIKAMLPQQSGSIINVGTVLVDHAIAGFPGSAAVASKGGLHALSRQLAAEFGKDNIRVNTLSLGIVRSPLQQKIGVEDSDSLSGLHLLDRIGEPKEVAEAAFYLADSEFITGATIDLAGGHVAGHSI